MLINSISDFRKAMRIGPYAWPGGYPLYFIASDGEPLSWQTVKRERRAILEALRDRDNSGWRVIGMEINYEDVLYDAQTGDTIEAAYI